MIKFNKIYVGNETVVDVFMFSSKNASLSLLETGMMTS